MQDQSINSIEIDGDGNIIITKSDNNTIIINKNELPPDIYEQLQKIITQLREQVTNLTEEFRQLIFDLTRRLDERFNQSDPKENPQTNSLSPEQKRGSLLMLAFLAGLPIVVFPPNEEDHQHDKASHRSDDHLHHASASDGQHLDHGEPFSHKMHPYELVHATDLLSDYDEFDRYELSDQDILFDQDADDLSDNNNISGKDHDNHDLLGQLFLS